MRSCTCAYTYFYMRQICCKNLLYIVRSVFQFTIHHLTFPSMNLKDDVDELCRHSVYEIQDDYIEQKIILKTQLF